MTRVAKWIGGLLLVVVGALALAVFRPWSEFSVYRMNRIFHPQERIENHRHMERIFPSRHIPAAKTPLRFESAAAPVPDSYEFKGERRTLADFVARTATTSLVVLRDGKVQSEQYFTGADAGSHFTSWSVAKSFVVTMIGMALLDGRIASLDDPVSRYVPELAGKPYGEATLRSVMQMASGIRFDETYTDKLSDINKLFYKVFIFGQPVDRAVSDYPREAPPSTRFRYVSSDSQVLSWVVRSVFGKPLAEILRERLWEPLGMESDAFWSLDTEAGRELGYCCLNATARDFARLGQLYLQDGVWQGRRLLPEGWVKMVTRPGAPWQQPGAPNPTTPSGSNGPRGYGMHFWVPHDYDGEYLANGVWGQSIWVSEKTGVVIVRTAVDPDYREHLTETFAVMRALAK
jgi:CubicO group peptidase (beta-lactamase class C family)